MTQTKQTNEPSQEVLKLWGLVKRVFHENKEGAELLEILKKQFFYYPVCPPGSKEGYGFYRQGQNDMLHYFDNCVRQLDSYTESQKQKSGGDV